MASYKKSVFIYLKKSTQDHVEEINESPKEASTPIESIESIKMFRIS